MLISCITLNCTQMLTLTSPFIRTLFSDKAIFGFPSQHLLLANSQRNFIHLLSAVTQGYQRHFIVYDRILIGHIYRKMSAGTSCNVPCANRLNTKQRGCQSPITSSHTFPHMGRFVPRFHHRTAIIPRFHDDISGRRPIFQGGSFWCSSCPPYSIQGGRIIPRHGL